MNNNSKDVIYRINSSGIAEVDVPSISSWNGFDAIIDFLEQIYSADIQEKLDGIDTRTCILIIEGKSFKLLHDDMFGNTIVAIEPSANYLLKEIYQELKSRIE